MSRQISSSDDQTNLNLPRFDNANQKIKQAIVFMDFVFIFRFKGNNESLNRNRFRNQLMLMVVTQVIVTGTITLQWIIMYMYFLFTFNETKTRQQISIINFFFYLTNHIFYVNHVKAFYLSMVTSRFFRSTFVNGLRKLIPNYQVRRANETGINLTINKR